MGIGVVVGGAMVVVGGKPARQETHLSGHNH